MKTLTLLLWAVALLLLGGCDTVTPEPNASAPLLAVEKRAAPLDRDDLSAPGRLHRITYKVSDGAPAFPESLGRSHGAQVQGDASILYTAPQGLVRLDDAQLPWQTTVLLPSGTPLELHVLYGPVRDTLLVHIYQEDVLLKMKSRTAPGGAFAFAMVQ